MTKKQMALLLLCAAVLVGVIHNPTRAAEAVRGGFAGVNAAAHSMVVFVQTALR